MLKLQTTCDTSQSHIGALLRAERMRQDLDIRAASKALHIQPAYLSAIETLDTSALPSTGYVLGFVRSYALYLGMDAKNSVAQYKTDIECPKSMEMRDSPHHVPKRKINIPKGSLVAGMVLSCVLVVVSWYGLKTDARSAQVVNPLVSQVGDWGFEAAAPTQNDPDMITLIAIGPSWVQIKDRNGDILMSRIMVPGDIFETKRQNMPMLSLRDAGAIELYRGGKRIGPIGQKGASGKNIPLAATGG